MKEFILDRADIIGIHLAVKNERILVVDKYGLELYEKYGQNGSDGWRYTYAVGSFHRVTKWGIKGTERYITFQRELLGLDSKTPIAFKNDDVFDLRICNLLVGCCQCSVIITL